MTSEIMIAGPVEGCTESIGSFVPNVLLVALGFARCFGACLLFLARCW
jgi:hypothetical protein